MIHIELKLYRKRRKDLRTVVMQFHELIIGDLIQAFEKAVDDKYNIVSFRELNRRQFNSINNKDKRYKIYK